MRGQQKYQSLYYRCCNLTLDQSLKQGNAKCYSRNLDHPLSLWSFLIKNLPPISNPKISHVVVLVVDFYVGPTAGQ